MSPDVAAFLAAGGWADAERQPLAGDASDRRYTRLRRGTRSAVLMQAPPDAALDAFIRVGALLAGLGLTTPRLLAAERGRGLLLLEDFGDDVFARLLDAGAPPAPLVDLAVDVLAHLHRHFRGAEGLPVYDAAGFEAQAMLFCEAALPGVADDLEAAAAEYRVAWAALLPETCAGPGSLLLCDYHAGNLVRLAERDGVAACGLLDFQDAGLGPRAYDLASLIEDARRDYPSEIRERALARYLAAFPELDATRFRRDLAVLAAMRHFRVLGIFERLARERRRPEYLVHRPRLWRFIAAHLEEAALAPVAAWLARWLPPEKRRALGG